MILGDSRSLLKYYCAKLRVKLKIKLTFFCYKLHIIHSITEAQKPEVILEWHLKTLFSTSVTATKHLSTV